MLAGAAWAIEHEFKARRAEAESLVRSVAELRASEVQGWVDRQMDFAAVLSDSATFAHLFDQAEGQDAAAKATLLARAIQFRQGIEADAALILDAQGDALAVERPQDSAVPDALRAAIREAVERRQPVHTGIYRLEDPSMPIRMDVVMPLLRIPQGARGVVVFRLDPRRLLFGRLAAWPVPSATGESVLWEQSQDQIVNISDPVKAVDGVRRFSEPVATSTMALARVLRGDSQPLQPLLATDYRNAEVLALVRPIKGTNWWVVSKINIDEVDAPARQYAWTALVAAAFALFSVAMASGVWIQRRRIAADEQEREEQRMRSQTLRLLEAIADGASDAVFAKDLSGRYVFYNRAAGRVVGRAVADVIGRDDVAVFGAAAAEKLRRNDARVIDTREPMSFEESVDVKGAELSLLSTKAPLIDAEGELFGVLGISRDVTEQRRAERALRESEAHHRSVVSVLDEGIILCDAEGRMISCNAAVEQMLGFDQSAWVGSKVIAPGWSVVRPDGAPLPNEETPPAIVLAGGGAQYNVPMHAVDSKGRRRAFNVSSIPVFSPENGNLISVVTKVMDVTERLRSDEELRTHREELEQLVAQRTVALRSVNQALEDAARFNQTLTNAMPGRVVYWTRDYKCRFANQAFADWFGTTPEKLIGVDAFDLHSKAYLDFIWPDVEAALRGERLEMVRETEDFRGRKLAHKVHYIPDVDADGVVQGFSAIGYEITELKAAEAKLTLANEALALSRDQAALANRAKTAFLANMSHEIRTPMNAIIGLTHLMSRDSRDTVQRERLAKVSDAAQHLLEVIDAILDLSKIEAGKLMLEDVEFALDSVLTRATEMVTARAAEKGLELIVDSDHLPRRFRGDPTRLSQILINLLANAVKFTERGWVRLRCAHLDTQGSQVHVRFEVQDTGPGIPSERQSALFAAFEQADNSISRQYGGTGLGLALSRQLARAMGGDAGVVSAPGAGSTFWFEVWLGQAAASTVAREIEFQKGLRALVVDDLSEARLVLSEQVTALGFAVDVVSSGLAAIDRIQGEMAAGRPYDALLIDWRMEPIDGLETLTRLRGLLGDGIPSSVLVTAFDDASMPARAKEAGFGAVLLKPFTASSLQDVLTKLLYRPGELISSAGTTDSRSEYLLRARHNGQRILLAEDNPVNREVAEELLLRAGLFVETAWDGARAVELALSRRYDLILMDMQMPVMDGLEATRLVRKRSASAIPIIAMTANAFVEDRLACLEAGMDDHVVKPVDPEKMYATMLRWLPLKGTVPASAVIGDVPTASGVDHEQRFLQRLSTIAEIDTDVGLRSVNRQVAVLERVFRRFVETYAGGVRVLLEDFDGRPETALMWRAACHSMRSALSTIGAVKLERLVDELERDLRSTMDPGHVSERGRRIQHALLELVDRLKGALAESEGG